MGHRRRATILDKPTPRMTNNRRRVKVLTNSGRNSHSTIMQADCTVCFSCSWCLHRRCLLYLLISVCQGPHSMGFHGLARWTRLDGCELRCREQFVSSRPTDTPKRQSITAASLLRNLCETTEYQRCFSASPCSSKLGVIGSPL